jgi:hypothetical protein
VPQALGGGDLVVGGVPHALGGGALVVGGVPHAFGSVGEGCCTVLGVDWPGSGGNSSFVVFEAGVDGVGCWTGGRVGGTGESLRGGTFGVETETTLGMSTRDGDLGVDGGVGDVGTALAVVDVTGTAFAVVVVGVVAGFFVVGASVVVVSLSFDLNNPVNPLKNPFFFVVDSGAGVVVVGRITGGKG